MLYPVVHAEPGSPRCGVLGNVDDRPHYQVDAEQRAQAEHIVEIVDEVYFVIGVEEGKLPVLRQQVRVQDYD